MNPPRPVTNTTHAWLWVLAALFLLRVLAQPLAHRVPTLPPFEAWQGSSLSYPLLLALQLGIIAVMVAANLRASKQGLPYRPRLARGLAIFSALYFAIMLARLAVWGVWIEAPVWFQRPLPAFFHLVLASWLMLIAREFGRPHE